MNDALDSTPASRQQPRRPEFTAMSGQDGLTRSDGLPTLPASMSGSAPRYRNERLNELAALEADWDSYGAPPLFATALRTADALTFIPTGTGGVQIDLHAGGVELEVTITSTGKVEEIYVRHV